jgi:hypothetical protein
VTLVWKNRGRIQLAGEINPTAVNKALSVIGGTGDFNGVRGAARVRTLGQNGQVQRVELHLLQD